MKLVARLRFEQHVEAACLPVGRRTARFYRLVKSGKSEQILQARFFSVGKTKRCLRKPNRDSLPTNILPVTASRQAGTDKVKSLLKYQK
jgi:hypothetical protein